ncbi:RidA family protein [Vibrio sp. SS-MA-C1-2]|uniref:RidA family protein n=1 Tax=Vibrio sp. SS-MA-C1-2 TaxID=2908646 RepID=UPI001F4748CE|nr:RidA family protein [Vibrio sp. SS-MA-C1-2]UJF17641.1 RidA family protein [Vibrio sp. SS-MA-C1-2]
MDQLLAQTEKQPTAVNFVNPAPLWSDVTVLNGTANFVEVAESDQDADMQGQVQQVFAQAEEMLALVNSNKSHISAVTIYITDFANMEVLNQEWQAWFPEGCSPSRACVKVELANPKLLVEMVFTASAGV